MARMKTLLLGGCLVLAVCCAASDCSLSKEFRITRTQTLNGTLEDPFPLPIPGLQLELLNSGKVVRQTRTSDNGKFDFGELPTGKYKMRVVSMQFCAPKIDCHSGLCLVVGRLRINEKLSKPVTVY